MKLPYMTTARQRLRKEFHKVPEGKQAGKWDYSMVPDGVEELTYQLEFGQPQVDALARKAAGNKRGVSRLGPFTVTIINRRTLP